MGYIVHNNQTSNIVVYYLIVVLPSQLQGKYSSQTVWSGCPSRGWIMEIFLFPCLTRAFCSTTLRLGSAYINCLLCSRMSSFPWYSPLSASLIKMVRVSVLVSGLFYASIDKHYWRCQNDCLNNIVNAERRGKRQVLIRPSSKVIVKFLSVMQRHGEFLYRFLSAFGAI